MDVILVDLVADNNQVEGDEAGTVHSLRSLVSSDDSTVSSSDRQEEEEEIYEHSPQCDDYRCSIIACSSPEIKALVHTIPESVQCRHQRSVSTLSFFPEDIIDDHERDEYSDAHSPSATTTTTTTTKRRHYRKGSFQPLVSPNSVLTAFGSMTANDHRRLSIDEDRDQESCQSEGRFAHDDLMSPLSIKSTLNDRATEELARRLERTSIGSSRSSIGSSATQRKPVRKRPSMHRRVSYNNLPNMSEIMCHPDFQSI